MDSIALLLELHARNHSARVARPELGANSQDSILEGLSEGQVRAVPQPGMNSVAWVLWHMARSEDQGVHLVGGGRQVFEDGNWGTRMCVPDRGTGTGHKPEDVARVSREINWQALLDYRAAVGLRTREIVKSMRPDNLDHKVDPAAVRRAVNVGAMGEPSQMEAIEKNWSTRTRGYALSVYALTHNVGHWGEITTIKGMVKSV